VRFRLGGKPDENIKPLFGTLITWLFWFGSKPKTHSPTVGGVLSVHGNANDLSATATTEVLQEQLDGGQTRKSNSAYYFAGDGGVISISDSPSLDVTNGLSLTAWVKIQAGGSAQPRILTKHVLTLV